MVLEWFGSGISWAAEYLPKLRSLITEVRSWFVKPDPERGILIVGSGGVGKTTLAAILAGTFDWLTSDPWEYQESFGIEHSALKDDPKVGIAVPPGQSPRRDVSWPDLERDLAAGRFRGVIVVSANGYHSLAQLSYKAHALYAGNKDDFLTAYRAACRDNELAVLRRATAAAELCPKKVWLLSVVAKEDLWWPERDAATAFYSTGVYADLVTEVASLRGPLFRHELVRTCLVINNFVSGEGELLAKNTAGYDHRQQVGSVRRLFEALNALREWEAV